VWTWLADRQVESWIMARFRRALNLVAADGEGEERIIALVTPELSNGPFHLVVDHLPPDLPGPCQSTWAGSTLTIGPWRLDFDGAQPPWEPTPPWASLIIPDRAYRRLRAWVEAAAAHRPTPFAGRDLAAVLTPLRTALCCALESGNAGKIAVAAAALAGLGPGLTPSGDDALAGVMLALWAARHPDRDKLCRAIAEAAGPRTTRLSRAFLDAASRGETDEPWRRLMHLLSNQPMTPEAPDPPGRPGTIEAAAASILTFGATSGLDMLQGFVQGYATARRLS
jgi:hypothetical protein